MPGTVDFLPEEALRISETFGVDHPFVWDRRQCGISMSPRLRALLKLQPGQQPSVALIQSLIHPDDLDRATASWWRSMETGQPLDVLVRLRRCDAEPSRWLNVRGDCLGDADDIVHGVQGVVIDVTRWYGKGPGSLDAPARGAPAPDAPDNASVAPPSRLFEQELLDSQPQMVWSATAEGKTDFFNKRWYEFTGARIGTTDGDDWSDMLHPEDAPVAAAHWAACVQQVEPYEIEYRLRRRDGSYAWVLARGLPTRDGAGNVKRWYGTCTDIDDRKIAENRRDLIAAELAHRIKNIFTVVNSLIALSTDHDTQTVASQALAGRVAALAEAYRHVMPASADSLSHSTGTLFGLMQDLLVAYSKAGENRVSITGDDFPIGRGAATALALLIHELATNGVKYGSLGHAQGGVSITVERAGDRVEMRWQEAGGGKVVNPGKAVGFGSGLADRVARVHLDATIDRTWHPDGLAVGVSMPFSRLAN